VIVDIHQQNKDQYHEQDCDNSKYKYKNLITLEVKFIFLYISQCDLSKFTQFNLKKSGRFLNVINYQNYYKDQSL